MAPSMAIYQILIKGLDGKTKCLQFSSPTISAETLKQILHRTTKIPRESLRLLSESREISNETLTASESGLFPSCSILLRLRGGKGGFGSLLRGAATKAGQKKTNNFDACRDMSGRRLRHVNAEKKLEEWKAEAEDRKLEKIAEDFIKKNTKIVKKTASRDSEMYIEKYKEDSARCMEKVEASVRQSFDLYEKSKRKVLPSAGPASKRMKIWMGKEKVVDDDDDDDEDEDEDEADSDDEENVSEVLDEGSSGSVSAGLIDGDSSGGGSEKSDFEEENGICDKGGLGNAEENGICDGGLGNEEENGICDGSGEPELGIREEMVVQNVSVSSPGLGGSSVIGSIFAESGGSAESELGTCADAVVQITSIPSLEKSLDFLEYNSASEMEVLGMERLKAELQGHGLKCGGTLQERAARLFLLKTTPIEKLPKKLLAKPKDAGK
eukprot:TRINITY_DN177_c0_g1_i1.p1 TRINITY_DN177_c0_g1~~TRINITY_DN177_c0_g1_i1.p1  ORF type:complete len:439 (-),score=110.91 TRINITY_DN177_c0_g1_i1:318-1634(-)